MGLETGTFISDLVPTNPPAADPRGQGDDHIRLLKSVLQSTFPVAGRAFRFPRFLSKTANYTILATDDETTFLVDTTAGNVVMTLPAVPATPFKTTIIKTTADVNTVSIVGTVSGGTLTALKSKDEAYVIGGNGTSYFNMTSVPRDGSLTFAKFSNVSASRILGNPTGAPAIPSEISLDPATLEFNGTAVRLLSTLLTELRTQTVGRTGFQATAAGGSASVSISAGVAFDATTNAIMKQAAAYTKTTGTWAVGSGNGALDTGAIAANTTYHWFVIKRPDTGVVDFACSTNPAGPTLVTNIPAAYTLKWRIFSIRTDGSSQWSKVVQNGDVFTLDTPGQVNTSIGTSRVNITLAEIPLGIPVEAYMRATSQAGSTWVVIITSLLEADIAPNATNGYDIGQEVSGGSVGVNLARVTDTLGRVAGRSSVAGVGVRLTTYAWRDITLYA